MLQAAHSRLERPAGQQAGSQRGQRNSKIRSASLLMTLAVTMGAAQPLPRHVASLTLSWMSWLANALWALTKCQGPQRSCKVHKPRAVHDSLSSFVAVSCWHRRACHHTTAACGPQAPKPWHPCSKSLLPPCTMLERFHAAQHTSVDTSSPCYWVCSV